MVVPFFNLSFAETRTAWVRTTSTNVGEIFATYHDAMPSITIELRLFGGQLEVYFFTGTTSFSLTQTASTPLLNDGEWHHVAMVRNWTDVVLYIDGLEVGSGTVTLPSSQLAKLYTRVDGTSIGCRRITGTSSVHIGFDGDMSDVRQYDAALLAVDVRQICESCLLALIWLF